MSHEATKLVVITEKILLKEIARIIESAVSSGYTVIGTGGKGNAKIRSSGNPSISDTFNYIKLEVVTETPDAAKQIADEIAKNYFTNYSGTIYREPVEVLHAHNF